MFFLFFNVVYQFLFFIFFIVFFVFLLFLVLFLLLLLLLFLSVASAPTPARTPPHASATTSTFRSDRLWRQFLLIFFAGRRQGIAEIQLDFVIVRKAQSRKFFFDRIFMLFVNFLCRQDNLRYSFVALLRQLLLDDDVEISDELLLDRQFQRLHPLQKLLLRIDLFADINEELSCLDIGHTTCL